uniref:DUF6291 domain-containing protein n=1 Tax=Prevotella sp. TaxID=59823 RepID=UPI0040262780
MNDSFILYTSYYALIEGLTDEQLGQLTRAIFLYARDGEIISLEPVVRMAFAFIKDNIERNQDKYQAKCEKNRQIALERERKKREAREKAGNTNVHERARTCENNTNVHERSPYDNDNEYDNDNDVSKETDNNIPSKEGLSISENPKVDPAKRCAKIDFAAIKEYWNTKHDQSGSVMRRLTLMSDQRKCNVRSRIREYGGDVQMVYKAIDKAMASDFMNGKNGKGWVASFDWMMCPSNFPKVLEGNYDNEQPAGSQQPQSAAAKAQDPAATARPSIGERYEQAKHQQPRSQQSQDDKFVWVIQQNLDDLKKNPRNKPAKDSLARFYEQGVLQRLGIDWKPEK